MIFLRLSVIANKQICCGVRACISYADHPVHRDAKASRIVPEVDRSYALAFNHYVFWHRFFSSCLHSKHRFWFTILLCMMQKIMQKSIVDTHLPRT